MKFEKNFTEIVSQITQELKKIQPDNIKNNDINSHSKDTEKSKMERNTAKENDFVNKSGIKYDIFINKLDFNNNNNNNNKNHENISNTKETSKYFENPRNIIKNNDDDTLPFTFDNHERHLTEEKYIQEKYFSFQNKNKSIKLKTFKKTVNISKSHNTKVNKFNTSSVDNIEENIFSYNTYSDNYIDDDYSSDTSSNYLSTSPFRYDKVVGINIPNNGSNNSVFGKIASPQPESKFNIGSTIASFNEIADFIYENDKVKYSNDENCYDSGNNNSIKKNDSFIKNYLDHTRYDQKKNYRNKTKNSKNNYITFKSLSNKKINSNDVIDRGCLYNKNVDLDDYLMYTDIKRKGNEDKNNNKKTSYFDYINVFELDNDHNESIEEYNSKDYILTEINDNTAEDKEENAYIRKDNYYEDNQDMLKLKLNKQNIYDDFIFNLSS